VLDLEQLHELLVQLLLHEIPDLVPDMPGFLKISKGENLLILKLVQIFINEGAFNGIFLSSVFIFVIVVLYRFALLVVVVVEIPDPVAKVALVTVVDANSPEVEPAE